MGDVVPMKPNLARKYEPIDHRRKLTDEQVSAMVKMRQEGMIYREIGDAFGVSTTTAHQAILKVLEPEKFKKARKIQALSERKRRLKDPQRHRDEVKDWAQKLSPEGRKRKNRLNSEYMKRRRDLRWEMMGRIKAAPCADCKRRYPQYVMQFDHRPGTRKLFNIGERYVGVSEMVLMEEIAKCDIVCANCHAIRTHGGERK